MDLEILPCLVETVNYQVVTYESLRGKGEEAKARKSELIRAGIEEKYIKISQKTSRVQKEQYAEMRIG